MGNLSQLQEWFINLAQERPAFFFSPESPSPAFTITGHKDRVSSVAFSSDGGYLASCSLDNSILLSDAQTGKAIRAFEGHDGSVWGLALSPDGKRMASASWDHRVKVWDVASGRELLSFSGHTAPVQSVAFSPDGKRVVSGSWDSSAKIWDADTGKVLATCEGDLFPTVAVAFSPDGKRVASGRADRSVIVWALSWRLFWFARKSSRMGKEKVRQPLTLLVPLCEEPPGARRVCKSRVLPELCR